MPQDSFIAELFSFLQSSPTPFHAVKRMAAMLEQAGFQKLEETDAWVLKPEQGYYVVRNGSTIVAFTVPSDKGTEAGMHMVGAHTDSPCLRVKPNAEMSRQGYLQLAVEPYGGVLLGPWFDRDLSLAGRVTCLDRADRLVSELIDFEKPIAVIPSLAIHLDREVNTNRNINSQTHLPPVVCRLDKDEELSLRDLLKQQIEANKPGFEVAKVLDYELSFYDTQPPALTGLREEFVSSARLDNLLSCFIGLKALLDSGSKRANLVVFNDHEEVGSLSAEGALGPFLKNILARLYPDPEIRSQVLARSMMISADNAHGIHPNFADRHDGNHGPVLNEGPVIKVNSNQRYATNSETSSVYRFLSEKLDLPYQVFVVKSDMACGSTIGPLTAGQLGVRTLDIGVPQFAMHSIREMAGREDVVNLYQVLKSFFNLDEVQLH